MNLSSQRHRIARHIDALAGLFVRLGFSPNGITLAALLCGVLCAVLYLTQHFVAGSIALLASAVLDLTDGAVARRTAQQTRFGAVIDWVVDKYVDSFALLGVGLSGTPILTAIFALPQWTDFGITALAIIGSFMNTFIKPVTYAELGFERRQADKIDDPLEGVGVFGRPETLIALIAGGFAGLMWLAVLVVAAGSNLSAIQRITYLYRRYS